MAEKNEPSPKVWHIIIPAATTVLVALIGLFTAVYQAERPFQQTAAALALTQTAFLTIQPTAAPAKTVPPTLPAKSDVPVPTPTFPASSIRISNSLYLPVKIYINSVEKGDLDSEGVKIYTLDRFPASIKWSVVKETTTEGTPLGHEMGGTISGLKAGDQISLNNRVDDQLYFYPIITNPTPQDCEVTINKGWKSEVITRAVVSAKTERVGLGYYMLFTNSNVTLDCGEQIYWWGAQPDEANPDSFFNEVEIDSGVIEFTLKP